MMKPLPPEHPMLAPVQLRRDLIADGYTDRAIARLVDAKVLKKLRHGAYVAHDAWEALDHEGRHGLTARAVVKAGKTDLVLSHVSSLPDWGAPMWGLDLSVVHVTRTDHKAGRREAGVKQHRGLLMPDDTTARNGVRITSPERTLIELTTMADLEQCLVVWNHFVHKKLTTIDRVNSRYRALSTGPRSSMEHWPDTLTTELLLRLADGRIETVGESRTQCLFWKQRLPKPVPQYEMRDADGNFLGRVDFAWPEHKVFLEFDGRVKYEKYLREGETAADAVIREKRREERICERTGWRCIRITWADLAYPERTAMRIRNFLFASTATA
ncbi:hypothetical protein NPS01_40370 [Nocardioides psychrotolerans]|uniref:Transcriptional regulator, AbiEi antitoxin, Type IV TA system n=2 Tax=Nocardioides psychrotolerans TaxID=1005945 RepID=A0A1I3IVY4_9ACTN|nr:hypothetical protein NPS01_40370 [Nocardioides psychrotolerans]SFI52025.1 Transcriptional regulator, AbiEi antitoxin, Type IV TA system [Nocardioides psychrotolerans]